jgi:hypothetical protein
MAIISVSVFSVSRKSPSESPTWIAPTTAESCRIGVVRILSCSLLVSVLARVAVPDRAVASAF